MLLRISNLPFDCELSDIKVLLQNSDIIQSILIKSFNKRAMAWININETSRILAQQLANTLDGRNFKGHKITTDLPTLCNS